jgi:tetratricopeptide (TPR) repeat protein
VSTVSLKSCSIWRTIEEQVEFLSRKVLAQSQTTEAELQRLQDRANRQSDKGEYAQAVETWQQVLSLARQQGNQATIAQALSGLGKNYRKIGQFQKALEYHNQALPLFREAGDKKGEAWTLYDTGAAYDQLGQLQKALELYKQASC